MEGWSSIRNATAPVVTSGGSPWAFRSMRAGQRAFRRAGSFPVGTGGSPPAPKPLWPRRALPESRRGRSGRVHSRDLPGILLRPRPATLLQDLLWSSASSWLAACDERMKEGRHGRSGPWLSRQLDLVEARRRVDLDDRHLFHSLCTPGARSLLNTRAGILGRGPRLPALSRLGLRRAKQLFLQAAEEGHQVLLLRGSS